MCLSACIQHLELGPSLPYIKLLFTFEIPHKLVVLVNSLTTQNPQLRLNATLAFEFIAEHMQSATPGQRQSPMYGKVTKAAGDLLQYILQHDLLETFIRHILNPDSIPRKREFWEEKTLELIRSLDSSTEEMKLERTLLYLTRLLLPSQGTQQADPGQQRTSQFFNLLFNAIHPTISEYCHILSTCRQTLTLLHRAKVLCPIWGQQVAPLDKKNARSWPFTPAEQ